MAGGWITLGKIASARSGDKGNHANIGVVAHSEQAYRFLLKSLTAKVIQDHFQQLGVTRTDRYELPRVWALNFVLYDALGGGASQSLRLDTQGKLLGTEVLNVQLEIEDADRKSLEPGG